MSDKKQKSGKIDGMLDKHKNKIFKNLGIITILLFILNIIVFLFLFTTKYEIFLVFIGLIIIIIKVFSDQFISDSYKYKLNFFIIEFSIFFLLIISQKIINILNILQ